MSQEGRFWLFFIKYFNFASELSGTDFFYKYAFNSQILCLPVSAGENLGTFCAENLTSKSAAIQQTNKQNRTKFEFENKKQIIQQWVDFLEFRVFFKFWEKVRLRREQQ